MTTNHQEINVTHPTGSYRIVVGRDLFSQVSEWAGITGRAVIITDEHVGPLYGRRLSQALDRAPIITVPAGEEHKTLESVHEIYNQMFALDLDRQAAVVALGGGVINDMAGFVAATYMRGVKFVTYPTSLLAMVDASVGGKTGVDMPQGKNLVGAFKQPEAVLVDLATLSTLPAQEMCCGAAEIIKHGLIQDPNLLTEVKLMPWEAIFEKTPDSKLLDRLEQLVADAIQVKRRVVEADPFEKGIRTHLNLGHTFGHAIEKVSGFEVRHGEGVAIGLVCAAHLSAALGYCQADLQLLIEGVLKNVGLPTRIPKQYEPEAILAAMSLDKKKANRKIRFVLMRGIGQILIDGDVPAGAIIQTLSALRSRT